MASCGEAEPTVGSLEEMGLGIWGHTGGFCWGSKGQGVRTGSRGLVDEGLESKDGEGS